MVTAEVTTALSGQKLFPLQVFVTDIQGSGGGFLMWADVEPFRQCHI